MTYIKRIPRSLLLLAVVFFARHASAHGFELEQNAYVNPTALTFVSNQPVLDNTSNPESGPANLFLDEFNPNPNNIGPGLPATVDPNGISGGATSYGTFEGFVQAVPGNYGTPIIQSATFKILSPLYYSDGTGSSASPAATGTYLQIYDGITGYSPAFLADDGGVTLSQLSGYSALPTPPSNGPYINITGSTPSVEGFPVSAEFFHELQKDLYIAPGSTQTYGEYGYAFDVTLTLLNPFTNQYETTLTSPPMVDVFALTDPDLNPGLNTEDNPYGGDFGDSAPQSQQDAATMFVYDAAMSAAAPVPEPPTFVMAALFVGILCMISLRRHRTRKYQPVARF